MLKQPVIILDDEIERLINNLKSDFIFESHLRDFAERIIEDHFVLSGDNIEDTKYQNMCDEFCSKVEGSDELQKFEVGIYEEKTLSEAVICGTQYKSPFEAMDSQY